MTNTWTQAEALALARQLEEVAPQYGAHVALTGGLLYKDSERKDADFLFDRIRQVPRIDRAGLATALKTLGVEFGDNFGFVQKASYGPKTIDFLFPELCAEGADGAANLLGGYGL
jgi:hypothetical protein